MLPIFIQIGEKKSVSALSWIEKQRDLTLITDELKTKAEEVLSASEQIVAAAKEWKK
jgi:hypothetical protein